MGNASCTVHRRKKVSLDWDPKEDERAQSTAPKLLTGGCEPSPLDLLQLALLGLGHDPGVNPPATSCGRNTGTPVSLPQ